MKNDLHFVQVYLVETEGKVETTAGARYAQKNCLLSLYLSLTLSFSLSALNTHSLIPLSLSHTHTHQRRQNIANKSRCTYIALKNKSRSRFF